MLGIYSREKVREHPATTLARRAARKEQAAAYRGAGIHRRFDEALVLVLYVVSAERVLDERCAHALYAARRDMFHLPTEQYWSANSFWCYC